MDWIWKDKSHCWKKTVLYSGRDYYLHHEGVAIILRKGVGRCLMKWKPISNRMVSAKLKGKHINITLIQCYAPKDDSSDEDKYKSYSQLQAESEKTSWRDLVVIMGELNAQVGRDNTDNERVMEKHGVENRNLTIMARDWWMSVVRDWWRSVL